MVDRVLRGSRGGDIGFWISKPGYDVKTASIMQMAFTSDAITPNLVAKGTTSISPAYASFGAGNGIAGSRMSTATISYGRTVSPPPLVASIATASSWRLPLNLQTNQLSYLWNSWHTYLFEKYWGNPSILDKIYGRDVQMSSAPYSTIGNSNEVSNEWCSARFTADVGTTSVVFRANHSTTLYIKYLILEA